MSNFHGMQNVGYTGTLVSFIVENKKYPIQDKIVLAGALSLLPLSKISATLNNPKVFNSIGVTTLGLITGLSIGLTTLDKSVKLNEEKIKKLSQRFANINAMSVMISKIMNEFDINFWSKYTKTVTGIYKDHAALSSYNAARVTGITFFGMYLISLGAGLLITFLKYHAQTKNTSKLESLKKFFAKLKNSHVFSTIINLAFQIAVLFFMPTLVTKITRTSTYDTFAKSKLMNFIRDGIKTIVKIFRLPPHTEVLFSALPVIHKNSRFSVMNGSESKLNAELQKLADKLNDVIPTKYKTQAILKNFDGAAPASIRFPFGGSIIMFDFEQLKFSGLTDDEILAIMLHEYGHLYHMDTVTLGTLIYVHSLLGALTEKVTTHFALIGSLGLFAYNIGYEAELKADKFSVELGYGEKLASGLRKIALPSRDKYKNFLEVDVHGDPASRIKKLESMGKQFLRNKK